MAVSDSGSWKLFIYPVILLVIIATIIALVITPFTSNGITQDKNQNVLIDGLYNMALHGNPFSFTFVGFSLGDLNIFYNLLPLEVRTYLANSVSILYYIPEFISLPITIVIYLSLAYALYVIIVMLIP